MRTIEGLEASGHPPVLADISIFIGIGGGLVVMACIVGAIVALAKPKAPTKNAFGERSMSIQTGGARWVASPESSEGEDEPPSPGGTPKRTQSMRI